MLTLSSLKVQNASQNTQVLLFRFQLQVRIYNITVPNRIETKIKKTPNQFVSYTRNQGGLELGNKHEQIVD